ATDLAARYGGDEFLIVLTEINKEGAETFCERLRRAIENRVFDNGVDRIQLTASLGYSITDVGQAGVDPRNLVRTPDVALYEAIKGGRNRVRSLPLQAQDSGKPHIQDSRPKKAG